jgi:hypothetical protein
MNRLIRHGFRRKRLLSCNFTGQSILREVLYAESGI